jgi:hypothetical protein
MQAVGHPGTVFVVRQEKDKNIWSMVWRGVTEFSVASVTLPLDRRTRTTFLGMFG